MIGIKEPRVIRIKNENPNEVLDGMTYSCPYCWDEIPRYDLRLHHWIWECHKYPQEKKRLFFMNENDQDPVHS